MRRIVLSSLIAILLAFAFVPGASALTVQKAHSTSIAVTQPSKTTPQASGGGCSALRVATYRDIRAKSCISFNGGNLTVIGNGYAWFAPLGGHGGVKACDASVDLVDDTANTSNPKVFDCTNDAKNGAQYVHYGDPSFEVCVCSTHKYHTEVYIVTYYNDGYWDDTSVIYSPYQYAP